MSPCQSTPNLPKNFAAFPDRSVLLSIYERIKVDDIFMWCLSSTCEMAVQVTRAHIAIINSM